MSTKERDLERAKSITATHWPSDPRPEWEDGLSLEEMIAKAISEGREEGVRTGKFRAAALRGALKAYQESSAWWEECERDRYCLYCEESAGDERNIDHAADCPRVLGAAALYPDPGEEVEAFLASDAGRLEAEVLRGEVERMASGWTQRVPMHPGVARQMGQRVVDAFNALRAARDKET